MRKFHKTIVFTNTPLTGYFRYKDYFQVYPANLKNMPKSKLQRDHPAILEFWTDDQEPVNIPPEFDFFKDFRSETALKVLKKDKILGLLSVISNHLFFRYNNLTGAWGVPLLKENPGKEAKKWSSKWNLTLYHWPELPEQLNINEFSKIDIPEVKFIDHYKYYLENPNFDFFPKTVITFPDSINNVLDSYYSKEPDIVSIIDTAISFSVSAMEFRLLKKTLSLLSSFTSMETMVNLEFRDVNPEKCKACGQLQYKVAQKYRDFLFKYIGSGTSNKKKFNSYYSLRSKIVHTGERLKTENIFSDIPEEEKDKEFLDHLEILQLGKLSIVNWLMEN